MSDKKTPKEASNIFHSIMKASVTTPQNEKKNIKNMAQKIEYKGHEFWITIDNAIHPKTNQGCYVAFVKNEEPGTIFGEQVKHLTGEPIFFTDKNIALTYVRDIIQNEIDGGIQGFF